MPSKNTFEILPIKQLIFKYFNDSMYSIDPFANISKLATVTNDIIPDYKTDYNLDALEFLKIFEDKSVDFCFYDPPYSVRQISEVYKVAGRSVNLETTRSDFWTKLKEQISRIMKHDGIVLSCGWNSGGIGMKNFFDIKEILLVPHGGIHNDTIVVIESRSYTLF